MHNYLEKIVIEKHKKIAALKTLLESEPRHILNDIFCQKNVISNSNNKFKNALVQQNKLAVIAEIKRRSPSRGKLATIGNPVELAKQYIAGGANAISVLTDEFFGSQPNDLNDVAKLVLGTPVAILQKDFILDEIQIAEAKLLGADAILGIVAILGKNIKKIQEFAHKLQMDVLVEVHNKEELNIALEADAQIIGINNRNLNDFTINIDTALQLVEMIPKNIIKIAESGIMQPKIAQQYYHAGFNAVLIGEALVKAKHPESFIKECQHG